MTRIELETDATNLQKALTTTDLGRTNNGGLFQQIRELIRDSFVYCKTRACLRSRSCNKVYALVLMCACFLNPGSDVFMSHALDSVTRLVFDNSPGAVL
jgi:hypothetical protein